MPAERSWAAAAYAATRAWAAVRFTTRTRRTVSGTSSRSHTRRQKRAQRSALGLRPWWMCAADTAERCARAWSSTTESTPPETPTRMRLPATSSSARPTAAVTSALLSFLELAIAHEPFEPALHQLLRLLLL